MTSSYTRSKEESGRLRCDGSPREMRHRVYTSSSAHYAARQCVSMLISITSEFSSASANTPSFAPIPLFVPTRSYVFGPGVWVLLARRENRQTHGVILQVGR